MPWIQSLLREAKLVSKQHRELPLDSKLTSLAAAPPPPPQDAIGNLTGHPSVPAHATVDPPTADELYLTNPPTREELVRVCVCVCVYVYVDACV